MDDTADRQPQSPADLFRVFNRLALQGFGGVLPVAQRELVERERWLTRSQFVELLSICQVLPGPNLVNMALMMGDRQFGWRGSVAAVGGLLAAPLVIVLLMAALYDRFAALPAVAGALRGMGAVAAGLVIATAIKLAPTLRQNAMGLPASALLVLLTVLGIAVLRWPLVGIVLGLGLPAMAWAAWRLKRA